jgi:hypothetical protein
MISAMTLLQTKVQMMQLTSKTRNSQEHATAAAITYHHAKNAAMVHGYTTA